jgi:predicted negative regulator of RcsB-dependent stress response
MVYTVGWRSGAASAHRSGAGGAGARVKQICDNRCNDQINLKTEGVKKMKQCMIIAAVILVFSISAYADPECDTKYYNLVNKVKSLTQQELSKETKQYYLTQLRVAYLLCRDGKKDKAREVLAELKEEHDFNTVFSAHDGN